MEDLNERIKSMKDQEKQLAQEKQRIIDELKKEQERLDKVTDMLSDDEKGKKAKSKNGSKSKKKKGLSTKGIVSLVLAGTILGTGIGYLLTRKSYTGPIKDEPTASDTLLDEEESKEITKTDISELSNKLIGRFAEKGLKTKTSDINRLVYAFNINQIATYHPEYIEELVGEESLEEVYQDLNQALFDLNTYNGDIYRIEKGNTSNFIYISDILFNASDSAKLKEIEDRFNEIASEQDKDSMNKKVNSLLLELLMPENELANLESGPSLATYTMVELIRDLFMDDLNEANQDLIKYLVPYAEDEEDNHILNNRHICNLNNIKVILENPYSLEIEKPKTLTR